MLVKVYVCADFLGDMTLRNDVTDQLRRVLKSASPDLSSIRLAFEGTPRGSTLRKLFIAWLVRRNLGHWVEEMQDELPIEYLADLGVALAKLMAAHENGTELSRPRMDRGDKCAYHEHNDSLPACE